MSPVDEDGNLLGRVNVVDAAVALVVLAAVVAGVVALADPFAAESEDGEEPATRYVTIDLGERSLPVAERVSEGDAAAAEDGAGRLTITDAYVGPAGDGNATVVVRARVEGTSTGAGSSDTTFEFAGSPLRPGDQLDVETADYELGGEVLGVAAEGGELDTRNVSVLLETRLSSAAAAHVRVGDAYRLNGRPVATVREVTVAPAEDRSNRTAFVGLSLRTIDRSGTAYFGDAPVLVGRNLPFRTDRYALSGSVVRWGNASLPGRPTDATVVVRAENVTPAVADGIRAGMVARDGGRAVARIAEKRTRPASVVVVGDDGRLYERTHPRNLDLTLTLELEARRTDDGLRFRARPLREGSDLAVDFRTIGVRGTVVAIDP